MRIVRMIKNIADDRKKYANKYESILIKNKQLGILEYKAL